MTTRTAVFRLEASRASGLGHIARCSVLIRTLGQSGWAAFVASSGSSSDELLQRADVPILTLDGGAPFALQVHPQAEQRADARSLLASIEQRSIQPDWIVLDHYGLDATWEREMARETDARVLVLEDQADRCHHADLIVSDSPEPRREGASASDHAVVLQGLRYALLDPYTSATTQPRVPGEPLATTLVYGSSDATRETEAALLALAGVERAELRPINVVIGPTNDRASAIEALTQALGDVSVHHSPSSLGDILENTDVLFTAGGQVLLEGLAARCACFVTVTAQNQERATDALHRAGSIEIVSRSPNPTVAMLEAAFASVPRRAPELLDRAQRAPSVDRLGARRILRAMERLSSQAMHRDG